MVVVDDDNVEREVPSGKATTKFGRMIECETHNSNVFKPSPSNGKFKKYICMKYGSRLKNPQKVGSDVLTCTKMQSNGIFKQTYSLITTLNSKMSYS